jgi:hypothetical protein
LDQHRHSQRHRHLNVGTVGVNTWFHHAIGKVAIFGVVIAVV